MKSALALGTFDGVHMGHRAVLKAASEHENPIALAFSLPPKAYFFKKGIAITDKQQKAMLIKDLGIENTVFLDFPKVKDVSAEDFFALVVEQYNPKVIFCGKNYTFGKDALGNTRLLSKLCNEKGIELCVCESVVVDDMLVSSSYIRELLKNGEIEKANKLLMSDFSFSAEIIHGDKRGRTIGFPTINQQYPLSCAELKRGVYKSYVYLDGKKYDCISNIGIRPTYKSDTVLCETYIKGFEKQIYGETVRVYLKEFIREEKKFSGLEELKEAIEKDLSHLE